MKEAHAPPGSRGDDAAIRVLWFGYLCFVIYGSLVPLDFKLIPIDQALARFSSISLLDVGTAGRADWIANGILYVPVGFLTALVFRGRSTGWLAGAFSAGGACCVSLALAVGVEFAQLFFPPRTVSLNDLLAEALGAGIGATTAMIGGPSFRALLANAMDPSRLQWKWLLWAYALLYLAFSLFPLDFVVSMTELQGKAASKSWGWWIVPTSAAELPWSIFAKLAAEIVMAVPVGMLLASLLRSRGSSRSTLWLITGLTIGLPVCLELLQFLLVSGISQGASVVARACGTCLGIGAYERRHSLHASRVQASIRRYSPALALLYLPALAGASGWFSSPWRGASLAVRRLATEVNFTPFFYHYYTTEALALFSLASVSLLYAPVGLLAWACRWRPMLAMVVAFLLAAGIEAGKLFPASTHPDPTNIWIAGAIAWITSVLLQRWSANQSPEAGGRVGLDFSAWQRALLPALVLCLMVLWVVNFPSYRGLLGMALVAYAAVSWRYPRLQFVVVPALLPLLDLAPISGRFFLDEFDCLVLVGLAIGYARMAPPSRVDSSWRLATALAIAVAGTFAIGSWRALTPLPWPDLNSFNSYLSPFNALRVAKGALWALLMLPLIIRAHASGDNPLRRFGTGMVLGLAGTVLFVLWERASFAGLADFSYPYRVSGPISAMHVGGAYLEGYLTVATAFLIGFLARPIHRIGLALGVLLLAAAVYATMVTYSRGGYLALFVVGVLMLLATLRRPQRIRQASAMGALLLGVAMVIALPVWRGVFAQGRLANVERDLDVRNNHWRNVLALRTTDWQSEWFGMGVGQFPITKYLASAPAERSAAYQLIGESGNQYLRIGGGKPIFMDQLVAIRSNSAYKLSLRIRGASPGNAATVQICHKWQLAAEDCQVFRFSTPGTAKWLHVERTFNSGPLGADVWYARRPVKLTLQNGGLGDIQFDDVKLESPEGVNLVTNGGFTRGLDNWSFTSDAHLAWHVKQMAIALIFDQGIFGFVIMGLLVSSAILRAGHSAWRGDVDGAAILGAIGAFLAVGLFDTLIDSPRFLFLFLTICWLAWATRLADRERQGLTSVLPANPAQAP